MHAATSEDEFYDDGESGPVGRELSWFDSQFGGPYLASDTTGINGDDKVFTLYVSLVDIHVPSRNLHLPTREAVLFLFT